MRVMSNAALQAVLMAVAVLSGCSSPEKPAEVAWSADMKGERPSSADSVAEHPNTIRTVNDVCPISGRPVNPSVRTAAFAGSTIGFCSGVCEAKWNTLTPAEKQAWRARQSAH